MQNSIDLDIKEKILDVAMRLFAQKGYEATTIREICSKSGAYQLSINYHFNGKENLYKEVLLKAFKLCDKEKLINEIKNLPPEQKLRKIINNDLKKMFCNDDRGLLSKILFWEYPNFSQILKDFIDDVLLPIRKFEISIFAEMAPDKDEIAWRYYVFSMLSQMVAFYQNPTMREKFFNMEEPNEKELEIVTDLICNSLIAGIKYTNMKEDNNE